MVAFASLGSIATFVFAWQLSLLVVDTHSTQLSLALAAAGVKGVTLLGQEWFSAIAAARVKRQLRAKLLARIGEKDGWLTTVSKVELNLLLTSGLDSLDAYFARFLPQVVYTALATPFFVFCIFNLDWLSALIILITLPLIPLFMVFIGWATAKVQAKQLAALTALSQHFEFVIRGITTLRVFSRAQKQVEILSENGETHRRRTMKVLSVTFLSGFALELIASLAVALVAVTIGLRLIDGTISFGTGLLILILAPDAYLPLRLVGANFHASAEGVAAIDRTLALLETEPEERKTVNLKVESAAAKLTVIAGPSGCGKSTLLKSLQSSNSAWLPQQSPILNSTALRNIVGDEPVNHEQLQLAIELADIVEIDLNTPLSSGFMTLSGGQRQRLALARTFYRALVHDVDLLLLDEPTSALDPERVQGVLASIQKFKSMGFSVVVVSHQQEVIAAADILIEVPA